MGKQFFIYLAALAAALTVFASPVGLNLRASTGRPQSTRRTSLVAAEAPTSTRIRRHEGPVTGSSCF